MNILIKALTKGSGILYYITEVRELCLIQLGIHNVYDTLDTDNSCKLFKINYEKDETYNALTALSTLFCR